MSNRNYYITRRAMYKALGLPDRIPLGMSGRWENVEVEADDWRYPPLAGVPHSMLTLPVVTLAPKGVANRIRVLCPVCRKVTVRFSCLKQHVHTGTCKP